MRSQDFVCFCIESSFSRVAWLSGFPFVMKPRPVVPAGVLPVKAMPPAPPTTTAKSMPQGVKREHPEPDCGDSGAEGPTSPVEDPLEPQHLALTELLQKAGIGTDPSCGFEITLYFEVGQSSTVPCHQRESGGPEFWIQAGTAFAHCGITAMQIQEAIMSEFPTLRGWVAVRVVDCTQPHLHTLSTHDAISMVSALQELRGIVYRVASDIVEQDIFGLPEDTP